MKFRSYGYRAVLMTLLSFPATAAATSVDFLVIGSPGSCTLYDQYEQVLATARKNALPPNAPFEIVSERQLMGDQITQAMQLSLLGSTYYLLLDEKGAVTGVPASAGLTRYHGCTPRHDSLLVTVASLSLTRHPGSGGSLAALNKGDTVLRIFSWRGSNYMRRCGAHPVFGWTGSSKGRFRAVEPLPTVHASEDDFAPLHLRIMKQLQAANERYDSLFSYFNHRTRQERNAPRWIAETTGDAHRYILKGSDEVVMTLDTSTRYLFRDIEQLLLGKPYLASYRQGIITIRRR